MSDNDNKNKPRKAELVKIAAGKVTRIEPPPSRTGILSRVAQIFYSPRREKKRIDEVTEVVKSHRELGEAYVELGRTASRFEDLDSIVQTDRNERESARLQALKNRLEVEQEVLGLARAQQRQAQVAGRVDEVLRAEQELELEERLAAIHAKRRRLQEAQEQEVKKQEPRSLAEELRAAVAKDTELDAARAQVLAEERRSCEEKIRKGEMTREEMAHHLAVVEASLNRHVPRKR